MKTSRLASAATLAVLCCGATAGLGASDATVEAALSPLRQLTLLAVMRELIDQGCQFIVATHSPIILAYPGATIYQLAEEGISRVKYEETEHFSLTRDFLNNRERYFRELFPKSDRAR